MVADKLELMGEMVWLLQSVRAEPQPLDLTSAALDEITKVKQKRRTLKNRGYAQNCRTKRLHQRQSLEDMNKSLQQDLAANKAELARVTQERDLLRQRVLQLERQNQTADSGYSSMNSSMNLNSDGQSSPEIYL
nr:unnamed protein product [Callosobruchus analis]